MTNAGPRKVAFVLEDDAIFRSVLIDALREGETFAVVEFDSIEALRAVATSVRPSVIVADTWGDSYLELAADERREIADLAALAPTILISERQWARSVSPEDLGVVCLMTKPLLLDRLVEEVERCMRQAALPAPASPALESGPRASPAWQLSSQTDRPDRSVPGVTRRRWHASN